MLFDPYSRANHHMALHNVTLSGEQWEYLTIALEYGALYVERKDKELRAEFLAIRLAIMVALGVAAEEVSVEKSVPTRRGPAPPPLETGVAQEEISVETEVFDEQGWARATLRKNKRIGKAPRAKAKRITRVRVFSQ